MMPINESKCVFEEVTYPKEKQEWFFLTADEHYYRGYYYGKQKQLYWINSSNDVKSPLLYQQE